jgi:hypothetical protein
LRDVGLEKIDEEEVMTVFNMPGELAARVDRED